MRTLRCIYVNCFNRLIYFPEVNTKVEKMHFYKWPLFSSTFSALTVCNIHFLYLKIVKIHFNVVPPFGPFWSVKHLNFGQRLPIRTTYHTLLESRHPEVTKNPYKLMDCYGRAYENSFGLLLFAIFQIFDTGSFS